MIGSRIGVYGILARLGQGDIAHVYGLERLHSAQAQSLEETLALVMELTRPPIDGVSIQRVGQTGGLPAPLPEARHDGCSRPRTIPDSHRAVATSADTTSRRMVSGS
jgi:hypothetical protein